MDPWQQYRIEGVSVMTSMACYQYSGQCAGEVARGRLQVMVYPCGRCVAVEQIR